jgi:hypothetical protein
VIARRVLFMLHAAALDAFQDPGVLGDRPRDCRLPDVGVIKQRLELFGDKSIYGFERSVLLSELEAEYASRAS